MFRIDRGGRRSGGVALSIKSWIQCGELSWKNNHEQFESLWAGIRVSQQREPCDWGLLQTLIKGSLLTKSFCRRH